MEPSGISKAVSAISNQVTALAMTVQDMQENLATVQTIQERLETPIAVSTPLPGDSRIPELPTYHTVTNVTEPYVSPPEKFDGNRKKFKGFITSCQIMFSLQPRTYASDYSRIHSMISLLSGRPQCWAHHLIHTNDPALSDWNSFLKAISELYDDPHRLNNATSALSNLKQGRNDMEDYVTEFRHHALESEWNEPALLAQFKSGLSEYIKDELARIDAPTSLESVMSLCIQIDRRYRERRAERAIVFRPPIRRVANTPASPSLLPVLPAPGHEPMQINSTRGPLTDNERTRRRSLGLCMYCGRAGHQLRECREKPNYRGGKMISAANNTMYNINATCASTHLTVPMSFQWNDQLKTVPAMIDSGASGCFIDIALASTLKIPLVSKKQPIVVQLLDGSPLKTGPVSQETIPLEVSIGTTHREMLSFDVVGSPIFPVILGLPWLRKHNPVIDWQHGTLSFSTESKNDADTQNNNPSPIFIAAAIPSIYAEFSDVFQEKGADILPPHRQYDCPIDLYPGASIPFGRIYPLSGPELNVLKDYINENLHKGFIRPSTSPVGAPIFFVGKKDGGLRPCIDYRALNKITIKNKYPLPLITEFMDRLRGAQYFTKLDLRDAYNLVRIRGGDEWKTAFRSRYGHFEYLVMPYGLCNAPATFQRFLNDIFRDVLDISVIIYLDDILIFSDTIERHHDQVKKVLQRLRKYNLYAKLEKCTFDSQEIDFLGFVLTPDSIRMDREKIKAVEDWPVPANRKGIQCFLGFCNFYRKFIKDFSRLVKPLTELTSIHSRFIWTTRAQHAFDELKKRFTTAPILALPNPNISYYMEVDASEYAIGAIFSQRTDYNDMLHPVAYYSKTLSPAQRNYDIGERELLAIKLSLEEWRHLLEGSLYPITIFTDHKNLEYLQKAKRLKPRQARWALFFSRFDLHITYRPGDKNGKADALSRLHFSEIPAREENILPNTCFLTTDVPLWDDLKRYTQSDNPNISSVPLQRKDGFLMRNNQFYAPQETRLRILQFHHDSTLGGHGGVHKTTELIRRYFWWLGMNKDIL
uniref:Gypsy retrotransposon integrase-like protein 1 n=1 Tax=Leptobrachium leishanense TaxID=445787 RepID=A0A8C5MEV2_9ANUR